MSTRLATIAVPATSGNLGSGFDALGLALDALSLTVELHASDEPLHIAAIEGEGASLLSRDASNMILVAAHHAANVAEVNSLCGALHVVNAIPLSRGLGSSAAACVAGAFVTDVLAGGRLGRQGVLNAAAQIEGHGDNVAPAVYGGVQVTLTTSDGFISCGVPIGEPIAAALYVPDEPLSTRKAREVLPREISMEDAVFNVGRAALTVAALTRGDLLLLRESLRDRLHQPARTKLMPYLPHLIQAATLAGAYGAALSGAGTTVCALGAPDRVSIIAEAMATIAKTLGVHGRALTSPLSIAGTVVTKV